MLKKKDLSAAKKCHIVECIGQGMKTLGIPQEHKHDHHNVKRFVADSKHGQVCADKSIMRKVSARQIHRI